MYDLEEQICTKN